LLLESSRLRITSWVVSECRPLLHIWRLINVWQGHVTVNCRLLILWTSSFIPLVKENSSILSVGLVHSVPSLKLVLDVLGLLFRQKALRELVGVS
jgi:hypothetical protein